MSNLYTLKVTARERDLLEHLINKALADPGECETPADATELRELLDTVTMADDAPWRYRAIERHPAGVTTLSERPESDGARSAPPQTLTWPIYPLPVLRKPRCPCRRVIWLRSLPSRCPPPMAACCARSTTPSNT
jgi:hypothetical protein